MTTIRAWGPDGQIQLVEVPARDAPTNTRPLPATTTKTTSIDQGNKGWISTKESATLLTPSATFTLAPSLTESISLTPTFYPTETVPVGSATIRVTLRFEDKTPLPKGAELELLNGGTEGVILASDGVVSDFGLPNGTFRLVVRDSGIYQILEPAIVVPQTPGILIQKTYTVPTVLFRGSIKGTLGEPMPNAVLEGLVCPTWLVLCAFDGFPFAAVAGSDGTFRARVSPGSLAHMVAYPKQSGGIYQTTPIPNRKITTNVNLPIILRKGFAISGRITRGDGLSASAAGSELYVSFIPESYLGNPNEYKNEHGIPVAKNGTFRSYLPADAYSVLAWEVLGVFDQRTELLIPRLVVRKDSVIGPFVLRYGKLRIRVVDGATGKPPTSGEFSVSVTDRLGGINMATFSSKPGWSGFLGILASAPGKLTVEIGASKPFVDPNPATAVLVAGKTATVNLWLPVTHKITGFLRSPSGAVITGIPSGAISATRTSDVFGVAPLTADIQSNGRYTIVAPPGSYRVFLIPGSFSVGWMNYGSGWGFSYELRRSVAVGAVNDTQTDLVIPSYSIQVITVDGGGKPLVIAGDFVTIFVLAGGNETQGSMYTTNPGKGTSKALALAGLYKDIEFYPFESLGAPVAYAPVKIPDLELTKDTVIRIVLPTPKIAVVKGTLLLSSGKPCKACNIYARNGVGEFGETTDASGKFNIDVRAGGTYNFTAIARLVDDPGAVVVYELELAVGVTITKETAVSYKLPAAVSYVGLVVDAAGKPISGAEVAVTGEKGGYHNAKTVANGRFSFVGLPGFRFPSARVTVQVFNLLDQPLYIVDLGTRRIKDGLVDRLVIPPKVVLGGQIASPVPLKVLRIFTGGVIPQDPRVLTSTFKYAFDLAAGNNYSILADLNTATSRCMNVELLGNLTARPGSPIGRDLKVPLVMWKGTVTTRSKKPLAGYVIETESDQWQGFYTAACKAIAVTDSTGSFKVPVIDGNYTLTVGGPPGNPWGPVVFGNQVVAGNGLMRSYIFEH